jgi:hypothetical protein
VVSVVVIVTHRGWVMALSGIFYVVLVASN